MNIEIDKEELEACLRFAKIQRWLEDDLHKKLYYVMASESAKRDPENKTKEMMAAIARNLSPTSFISALQDTRKLNPAGKEFCDGLCQSIEILMIMSQSMPKPELETFISEKEIELGLTEDENKKLCGDRVDLEKIIKFISVPNNFKYVKKLIRTNLEKVSGPLAQSTLAIVDSIPLLSDETLRESLGRGYNNSSDSWEFIVDVIDGVIKIRGMEDITDDELKLLDDYGNDEED